MNKKQDQEKLTIEMPYEELANGNFHRVIRKLGMAEVSAASASRIRKITKAVSPVLDQMKKEYEDTVQKDHDERVKAAGIAPPKDGEPVSEEQIKKMGELNAQRQKEEDAFGKKVITFDVMPLGPQHLEGIKISAGELDALGPFFDEEGTVRTEMFKKKLGVVGESH